jgi:hypothetical protein
MVDWLCSDGMISPEEAQRTIARCSQAESAQHPLVRLAAPCRFVWILTTSKTPVYQSEIAP